MKRIFFNKKLWITVIMVCIFVGILYVILPVITLIGCMIADERTGMSDIRTIVSYVENNNGNLEKVIDLLLAQGEELDVVIKKEEISYLHDSEQIDEKILNETIISGLFDEQIVEKITVLKKTNVNMVVFQTNSSGVVNSGGVKGFYYYDGSISEDALQYWYFMPYTMESQLISDYWYCFEMYD